MSDELTIETGPAPEPQEPSMLVIENVMDEFISTANIDTVYQKPVKHGETLIIPAAETFAFLGFGLGSGGSGSAGQSGGAGGGGGGGGSTHTRPVAVIISTPQGVRVDPVYDLTKVAVTGLATVAMVFGALARIAGMRRKVKHFQDDVMS